MCYICEQLYAYVTICYVCVQQHAYVIHLLRIRTRISDICTLTATGKRTIVFILFLFRKITELKILEEAKHTSLLFSTSTFYQIASPNDKHAHGHNLHLRNMKGMTEEHWNRTFCLQ